MYEKQPPSDTVAAVDLGSNSFHMVVARWANEQLTIVDRIRERVALAEGLDDKKHLTRSAQDRALACLERFGQRLRDVPKGSVRAVGTNTLRRAKDADVFLVEAKKALGHPIEVISGREEARLIYLGVAQGLPEDGARRLVVDIGGGSTECIIGKGFDAGLRESLHMGCVNFTQRFFPNGEIRKEYFDRAEIAARLELQTIEEPYKKKGWDVCIGSSGTIVAVEAILRENGWSEQGITEKGLRKLRKAIVAAEQTSKLSFQGMQPDRASVLPGGVAILSAIFDSLGIEKMTASAGALREGLLYDLIGRIRHDDIRDHTIRLFQQRFEVDVEQAQRVERTSLSCFEQVAQAWELPPDESRMLLTWAAQLHEIGLAVSHSGYHRHGAYLVANSDMPGFSREDQQTLAALVIGQRRKVSPDLLAFFGPRAEFITYLSVLLRLSVRLNRNRSPRPLPSIALIAKKNSLDVIFPNGWLAANPLTVADLEEETSNLKTLGFKLTCA